MTLLLRGVLHRDITVVPLIDKKINRDNMCMNWTAYFVQKVEVDGENPHEVAAHVLSLTDEERDELLE